MKTNQIMLRPMGQFKVEQRTKDAYFNATSLLKQWNDTHETKKILAEYLSNKSTKEFIDTIVEREKENIGKSPYLTCRGKNGGTWMSPVLFVDFAMWLSPSFKYDVIKFVFDQMIRYRNEAGEAYKRLSSAVSKIVKPEKMKESMSQIAEGLNWCIFNNHKTALRNENGTEENQRKLFELERLIATLIEDGFIKKHDDVMEYLRKQWRKSYIAELQA